MTSSGNYPRMVVEMQCKKQQQQQQQHRRHILDPREKFLQGWNVVFVLSCVTAVALDPLFFYLPVIIQDKKCIWFDNRLWITVLVLRSFFDFIYLVHIILQFRTGFIDEKLLKSGKPELNTNARKIAKKYLWPRSGTEPELKVRGGGSTVGCVQ